MARKLIAGAAGRGQGAEAGTGLAPAAARTEGRLAPAGGFFFFFNLQVLGQAHGLFWTFWGLRHILTASKKFSFFFFFFCGRSAQEVRCPPEEC